MTATRSARAALIAALAAGALAGCGGDDSDDRAASGAGAATAPAPSTTTSPSTTTTSPAGARSATVYLLRDEKIAPVHRAWEQPTTGVAAAALRALLAGPVGDERDAGLTTAIPEGTTLNGVSVEDGTATVDLSSAFAAGGGSASMSARLAQVVATLTRFPTIERVAFRLDGEPARTIGGEGVVVDPPLGRADIEATTPQILIESPHPGAAGTSPLRVTGTANTFEATFVLELLDRDGASLAKQVVTATSGSGTRGTFDASLAFDAPPDTALTLYAYESSAEDGRPLHEVRIPLGPA